MITGEKLFGDFCREYFKWRLLTEVEDICRDYDLSEEQIEETREAISAAVATPVSLDLLVASWGEKLFPAIRSVMESEMDISLQTNRHIIRQKIKEIWHE